MSQTARVFRVFVSSTFSDLKAERNALQAYVFPRLRALCQQHGARFQAIDLRWGVSDEASLDQQTMSICLGEIERCQQVSPRPNFVVLLGDRYGWRPAPSHIPADEFDAIIRRVTEAEAARLRQWYRCDDNVLYRRDDPTKRGVYLLQPRQVQIPEGASEEEIEAARELEGKQWQETEKAMHAILARAAAGLDARERLKYTTSATHQEIAAGALSVKDASEHVVCFFRSIAGLPEHYDPAARDFMDLDKTSQTVDREAHRQQDALKADLTKYLPKGNIHTYQARWTGAGITTDHVDQLCADVYAALEHIILAEIANPHDPARAEARPTHIRVEDALDDEGRLHARFAEERLRFFVGREIVLKDIAAYLLNSRRHTLAVIGGGGTGKSALLARAVEQAQAAHPRVQVVYRFIGVTPGSSDGRGLLESLCREISRRYGASEDDVPLGYRDLVAELGRRMAFASAENPLILFLDSLDQLAASQDARGLAWLPAELPEHVAVVVSTRPEQDIAPALQSRQAREFALGGLEPEDGESLLKLWLADAGRELQKAQRAEVLTRFQQSQCNPLYLKLAFEEARLWTSYQPQEQLTTGLAGIIQDNMVGRLKEESNHGELLVSRALGYLAAARDGLAEDELVDLLSRDLEVYDWFLRQTYHLPSDLVQRAVEYRRRSTDVDAAAWLTKLKRKKRNGGLPREVAEFLRAALRGADGPRLPIVLWSRLSFDLAPYLTERMVDGSSLLYFYHRELGEVSKALFLAGDGTHAIHTELADYFRFKADPAGDASWTGRDRHGLAELPYHLTQAGAFDEAYKVLTDFRFLEHKAEEVGITRRTDETGREQITSDGIYQLQQDFERALVAGGSGAGLRAPLILTARRSSGKLTVYCPVCNQTSPIEEGKLGKVIPCPQKGCEAPLKVNPFVIDMIASAT